MNIKSIMLFVSGLVVGGTAGVISTRKYFQDKYLKQYEQDHDALEKYYNRVDEYEKHDTGEDKDEEIDENSNPGGRMSSDERNEIKKKLNQNWAGTTNYAGMYNNADSFDEETDLAEDQHPSDDIPEKTCRYCDYLTERDVKNCSGYCDLCDDHVNYEDSCSDFRCEKHSEYSQEEEAFDEHQKNKNKPPKIISAEAYSNLPAYIDQNVLYFYVLDGMLCDDNDEPVEEPERLVGDALTKYGFFDNDEQIIFVMNYALDTCYEIQKIDKSWTDSH